MSVFSIAEDAMGQNTKLIFFFKLHVSISQLRWNSHQKQWLTQHVPLAAGICGSLSSESLIYLFYCRKWESTHVSIWCTHACFVCDQVRPTDCQYRDYKRSGESFWSKLEPVKLDTAKLEHLFETKSKEIPVTKVCNCTILTPKTSSSSI